MIDIKLSVKVHNIELRTTNSPELGFEIVRWESNVCYVICSMHPLDAFPGFRIIGQRLSDLNELEAVVVVRLMGQAHAILRVCDK